MGDLTGRTALVTGASRGIGRAIAERLAADGARVAVHHGAGPGDDLDAKETVEGILARGGDAFAVAAEFGPPGDVDRLFDGLLGGLSEPRLDILVNNAAIPDVPGPPEDITPERFDRLMAVNARAPLFTVRRALPLIPDGGRIVNISTGLTRFANPREVMQTMSKAALEMVTLHFARHLGPRGITVNTVAPGVVDTGDPALADPGLRAALSGLSAFGRLGEPDDIAGVVAFLASSDARWITGAWIDATGGTLLG
ncbi:SDR family NAD(P)-dependent oxidoreductase [Thermomonospora umbrina]|uniref:NAD(P)-dependent dehydrogenase (Short-subunit alcohol dehydrogenase family) n=1 Tax=Thermomonospora umbrina TaxID=111806 RepID=A0A3D9SZD7_9ACTN|nr:SDR family oxidoreductase [Thermomonospora umbrina]REF00948.1 NAD(P)-dependent dehydrogenase (short-subunit alcohol dehydrogenase family) [Thermomonospora umbrina]